MSKIRCHLHPLTTAEEPILWEFLYHAIHVPEGAEPPPRSILDQPSLAHYVRDWGRWPGDLGYMAVDDATGQPVGAAWLRLFPPQDPGYGFAQEGVPELSISLLPAYRGQGLGSRLLQALIQTAQLQFPALSLSVSIGNPAQALYERLGFVPLHVDEGGSLVMLRKSP